MCVFLFAMSAFVLCLVTFGATFVGIGPHGNCWRHGFGTVAWQQE